MSKSSRFLRLPAEIKNMVYEFALTSDDDLVYIPRANPLMPGKDIFAERRVAAIPKKRQSKEFNRLKYVNKELRRDTARLELKYNQAIFVESLDVAGQSTVHQFLTFFKDLHCSNYGFLRKVRLQPLSQIWIQYDQPESISSPAKLAKHLRETLQALCAYDISTKLPKLQLEYRLPEFERDPEELNAHCIRYGLTFEVANAQFVIAQVIGSAQFVKLWLRNEPLPDRERFRWGERLALEYRQTDPIEQYQDPNLKIIPVAISHDTLKQSLETWIEYGNRRNALMGADEDEPEDVIAAWIPRYVQWQENGI